jgi:uncharacterized repeat protein (TIGR03803 family)
MMRPIQAQTFTVLHNFSGGMDGAAPDTGLTIDRSRNLYGTAFVGSAGYGTIFKLTYKNSGWLFSPLYSFQGFNDGANPDSRVSIGPNGTLYGTTEHGGVNGYGTVFNLRPPQTVCRTVLCPWTKTVLYAFTGGTDSFTPQGDLTFDQSDNLYGTAYGYQIAGKEDLGGYDAGSVYELVHSNGGWTINVLYGFTGFNDGSNPEGGVIFDQAGNLYGTATYGGAHGEGTVFQLTHSGSGWIEQTLQSFSYPGGFLPQAGLLSDQAGNMYGATFAGGNKGGGTVFELTPSNGGWAFTTIYELPGSGTGPLSTLAIDSEGNLYGTSYNGGQHQNGSVFKLTQSNGVWTYIDLYDFTGGSDGSWPFGSVAVDTNGTLYGTASSGGAYGDGVVWEIAP